MFLSRVSRTLFNEMIINASVRRHQHWWQATLYELELIGSRAVMELGSLEAMEMIGSQKSGGQVATLNPPNKVSLMIIMGKLAGRSPGRPACSHSWRWLTQNGIPRADHKEVLTGYDKEQSRIYEQKCGISCPSGKSRSLATLFII